MKRKTPYLLICISLFLTSCGQQTPNVKDETPLLLAGASSASILPTVDGSRDYTKALPPLRGPVDPVSPGLYVEAFDQGQIDIDNGKSDGAWVHDDIRSSALALQSADRRVILFSTDVYLISGQDGNEIIRRARQSLPEDWRDADILFASTHNHHGPGTLFSVNDEWYDLMATQTVSAIVSAVSNLEPATLSIASGDHRFGINDVRDPIIIDPKVHLVHITRPDSSTIASLVQWNVHVESTLTWAPPVEGLEEICEARGWQDCTAEGRYITSDYPGELRGRLQDTLGGEVLYFVGAIGSQIGPGEAPVWQITEEHPLGNGWTVPEGAAPLRGMDTYLDRNFVKAEAIGISLADHVTKLAAARTPLKNPNIVWQEEAFYTRLHQRGFAALLAQGALGWQSQDLVLCRGVPSDDTCTSDEGGTITDPVAGPSRLGEYVKSKVGYLSLNDEAGLLFMPGELPPEYIIGLPQNFNVTPEKWYRSPLGQHARGTDYELPGYILSLIDDPFVMAIGLGNDQLGYFVPIGDIRVPCAADLLGGDGTCRTLHDAGAISWPNALAGQTCKTITDNNGAPEETPPDVKMALEASCRYGLMLGQLQGYSEGHYEETNSAGWDLISDSWAAYRRLFPEGTPERINSDFKGQTPEDPPA